MFVLVYEKDVRIRVLSDLLLSCEGRVLMERIHRAGLSPHLVYSDITPDTSGIVMAPSASTQDLSRIGPLETACTMASMDYWQYLIDSQTTLSRTEQTQYRVSQSALIELMSHPAKKAAADFTEQHEAAAAKVESERDAVTAERDASNTQVATLTQEKSDVEKRLNSALASFAVLDEQRKTNLEQRDSALADLALKTAAEDSCRNELGQSKLDLAASKSETEQLRTVALATLGTRQITMDKEMNDMRENLGREMVAAREANSKLTTSTTELTDLRTKYTVTEESLKLAKTDTERLETEKSAKTNELQAAQTEKVSASSFSFSENTRPSKCAAGQHPDKTARILSDAENGPPPHVLGGGDSLHHGGSGWRNIWTSNTPRMLFESTGTLEVLKTHTRYAHTPADITECALRGNTAAP